MFNAYHEIFPPTGVDHAVACRFLEAGAPALAVAKAHVLDVYRIYRPASGPPKLALALHVSLAGVIQSMAPVALPGHSREGLALTFKDAKLSVVAFDPERNDLETLSLHQFEEAEYQTLHENLCRPVVQVDPAGRCMAMPIYGTHLAVLPLQQESASGLGLDLDTDAAAPSGGARSSRSPVRLPYVIDLRAIDARIRHIRDVVFLGGYFEPTILIAHEPVPTYPGRYTALKDTCAVVAISLNVVTQSHTVVWAVDRLPSDLVRMAPVPAPFGGALLFCANALLYVQHTTVVMGQAVNQLAAASTAFRLTAVGASTVPAPEDLEITLDASVSFFLQADRLLLSLRNGNLYVVQLFFDGRAVTRVAFHATNSTAIPSCICPVGSDLFFLGSRLGDSLLIQMTDPRTAEPAQRPSLAGAPPDAADSAPSAAAAKAAPSADDDLDELDVLLLQSANAELHRPAAASPFQLQYTVCDSLLNVGPVADLAVGEPTRPPASTSAAATAAAAAADSRRLLEVITCSGHDKNGALCVLQRAVQPAVISAFTLAGARDAFAVRGASSHLAAAVAATSEQLYGPAPTSAEAHHRFLLISQDSATLVLECGEELTQLPTTDFYTAGPTIFAGSVGNDEFIVQVYSTGVRLLTGAGSSVQELTLDAQATVATCSLAGTYLLLQHTTGDLTLVEIDREKQALLLVPVASELQNGDVAAACLYEDVGGFLAPPAPAAPAAAAQAAGSAHFGKPTSAPMMTDMDELDLEIYGPSATAAAENAATAQPAKRVRTDSDERTEAVPAVATSAAPAVYAVLCRSNGALEIATLPGWTNVYRVSGFTLTPPVLRDQPDANAAAGPAPAVPNGDAAAPAHGSEAVEGTDASAAVAAATGYTIVEVALRWIGRHPLVAPYLLARTARGETVIYQLFRSPSAGDGRGSSAAAAERLAVRFSRVEQGHLTRLPTSAPSESPLQRRACFRPFTNIGGHAGVFICGERPAWLFVSAKGGLRGHAMRPRGGGAVLGLSPFHNVNCARGLVYIGEDNALVIAQLDASLSYGQASWPVRKIALRRTALKVAYHPSAHVYALATAAAIPYVPPVVDENGYDQFGMDELDPNRPAAAAATGDGDTVNRARRPTLTSPQPMTAPAHYLHQLELVVPGSFETIDSWAFRPHEHVCAVRACSLTTENGRRQFLCVGTAFAAYEDLNCKGRILVFDVASVVPEPGQPQFDRRFRLVYQKEYKQGPVTALNELQGNLAASIGQEVYLFALEENTLNGVAFLHHQTYATSLCAFKSYLVIGDICKSVCFARFKDPPAPRNLYMAGRDAHPLSVVACELLVDDRNVAFLVGDVNANLHIFSYSPQRLESGGGQKLLRLGDFHLGSGVGPMARLRVPDAPTRPQRHMVLLGTLDGGLGVVVPVAEKRYQRLRYLQQKMTTFLKHRAGLNPRAFRLVVWERPINENRKKNVLDGTLLNAFPWLSLPEKRALAQQIGSSVDQIMLDLDEIDRCLDVL